MAKIELTVKQIMNLGLWDKVCDYKGWEPWILNEGRIDENELVEFDDEFKKEEKEINLHEAIDLMLAGSDIKVLFNNGNYRYIGLCDDLGNLTFSELLDVKLYLVR
ncbi:hypothetical protein NSS71_08545 [Niallia sp. FSL W8-0951]|uniref:hypothetical protein n=1 Tax=unclassified Niallia TaxID=2837522 RepID=UPI0030F9932F